MNFDLYAVDSSESVFAQSRRGLATLAVSLPPESAANYATVTFLTSAAFVFMHLLESIPEFLWICAGT